MKKRSKEVIRNKIVALFVLHIFILNVSCLNSSTYTLASPSFSAQPCNVIPSPGDPSKLLILLQGINSTSKSSIDTWQHVIDDVGDMYGGIAYYSYKDGSTDYEKSDTGEPLLSHVDRLHRMIDQCASQPSTHQFTTIDLIGHSLGGAIAYDYIKLYGDSKSRVKHVITLDSPINGSYVG